MSQIVPIYIYLGRRHNGECIHNPVRVLFSDLADEQGAHTGAGAAPKWVCELEALQTVAALGLLSDHVENRVNELSALGVVALGPVVAGPTLTENKCFGLKDLAERTWSDGVHGARL